MPNRLPRLFDSLIGALDKLTPFDTQKNIERLVRQAALFWFDDSPDRISFKHMSKDKFEWLCTNLYLPFPVTAIEDRATLTIFADPDAADRDLLRGCGVERAFVDVLPCGSKNTDVRAYVDPPEVVHSVNVGERGLAISLGWVRMEMISKEAFDVAGSVSVSVVLDDEKVQDVVLQDQNDPRFRAMQASIIRNVGSTMQWLVVLDDPDHFILEDRPLSADRPNPFPKRKAWTNWENRIRRAHERPVYTVLRPRDIRHRMGLPEPTAGSHASPMPHERRAHTRRLMSERFTKQKGKTIPVKSSWVGAYENVVGGRRYRVIIDH